MDIENDTQPYTNYSCDDEIVHINEIIKENKK